MKLGIGRKNLFEATAIIQELMTDPHVDFDGENVEETLRLARGGLPGYDQKAQELVSGLMERYGLEVSGMGRETAAREIYKYLWGLDVLEDVYRQPYVDEVRVNDAHKIYYLRNGVSTRFDGTFRDREHIKKILARMFEHDRVSLDESNPGAESIRMDGTRLTALTAPITPGPCFVLRKHGTFEITEENYIKSRTMNRYILRLLQTAVKGRANIIISGDANIGKTTLLRFLVRYLSRNLRVLTIETDRELLLHVWYPERDIISMEAHPELGWDMARCFTIVLRFSPDVVIVGEARGLGEAGQLINVLRSGHHGSMCTIHVYNVYEAIRVIAQMALEEGRRLPVELLENQLAEYVDLVVQMYGNADTGTKMIEHIVEVSRGKSGPEFRDLCVWKPSEEGFEKGDWVYPNGISERLATKLFKYGVSKKELAELERMRINATAAAS